MINNCSLLKKEEKMNKTTNFLIGLIFVPSVGIYLFGLFLLYAELWLLEKVDRLYNMKTKPA